MRSQRHFAGGRAKLRLTIDNELNAYLCTYRHYQPSRPQLRKTASGTPDDPLLREFLDEYEDSYFDWGDDPSFFCALRRLGDVNKASWGVCRADVRAMLAERDVVVYFCGRQDRTALCWRYYFIGFGTVKHVVDRRELWTNAKYKPYREFYNVLACWERGELKQKESFHPYHEDWDKGRAAAPYVIFDPDESAFNVHSPHHVATWNIGHALPEVWNRDRRSQKLENLLFEEREITRRLRTSAGWYAHVKLNLMHEGRLPRVGRSLPELCAELKKLV